MSFTARIPFNITSLHLATATEWGTFRPWWTGSQRYSFPCSAEDVTITGPPFRRYDIVTKNRYFDPETGGGREKKSGGGKRIRRG